MAKKLIGNAIIGQSGGPSSVINSSLLGAIKTALESGLPKPSKFSLLTNRVKVPIRKKSSSSSEIVARIPNKNYEVDQTGNTFKNRNGKLWYEVKYEDITGWIYETNLKVVTK